VNGIANAMQKFPGLFDGFSLDGRNRAGLIKAPRPRKPDFKPDLGDPFRRLNIPQPACPLFLCSPTV